MSQAVEKAARILWWLAERAEDDDHGEQSLRNLAAGVGLDKATAYRIAQSLAKYGLVSHNPATRDYRIGPGAIQLARAATKAHPFLGQYLPVLKDLARATEETVSLSERRGLTGVTIHEIESQQVVRYANKVGVSAPLYMAAGPRSILTWSDEATRRRVLDGPIESFAGQTLTSTDELAEAIAADRAAGYCHSFGERHAGVHSLAAPILGADGYAMGAVSILWPSRGAEEDGRRLREWPPILMDAVRPVSAHGRRAVA